MPSQQCLEPVNTILLFLRQWRLNLLREIVHILEIATFIFETNTCYGQSTC